MWIFCLKIYFPPSVSSSSGFVNLTMLLLSCNLRCRWLFYINLVETLPSYFRRWHNFLVVRTWDWKRILYFYCYLFIDLFTLFQNWLAFSNLDEPPFSEHNSIYFSNDKPPAQSHYNAFCKVSIPVLLISLMGFNSRHSALNFIEQEDARRRLRGMCWCKKELLLCWMAIESWVVYATNVCRRDGDVLLRTNTLEDKLHTRVPLLPYM